MKFLFLCHLDRNSKKNPPIRSQVLPNTSQHNETFMRNPLLFFISTLMTHSLWDQADMLWLVSLCQGITVSRKLIQRGLDWSPLPLKEDMHGFSCPQSQATSHIFVNKWLVQNIHVDFSFLWSHYAGKIVNVSCISIEVLLSLWGCLNLFFFFFWHKVQQQLTFHLLLCTVIAYLHISKLCRW